jgi:hypothetical protein
VAIGSYLPLVSLSKTIVTMIKTKAAHQETCRIKVQSLSKKKMFLSTEVSKNCCSTEPTLIGKSNSY